MKSCSEIQHLLYLYDDLASAEKALVTDHLHQCEACRKLFKSLKENQALIQRAAQVSVVPQHAGRLTSNIMEAIHLQTHKKQSAFAQWIESTWTKYALAATSLVLIFLFMIEQQPAPHANMLSSSTNMNPKTVTLNTTTLLEEVRKSREAKKHSPSLSLYACAKSGSCENEIIKNFKLKKSS